MPAPGPAYGSEDARGRPKPILFLRVRQDERVRQVVAEINALHGDMLRTVQSAKATLACVLRLFFRVIRTRFGSSLACAAATGRTSPSATVL